jgi:tetratricopeptide (TPR) repeat protein
MKRSVGVCILLAAITWAVFAQTVEYDFINYDDNSSVYENAEVTKGLSLHGIGWALTHSDAALWNPLSTISHMADCQMFGLKPGGHHFNNVLLHSLAVIVLFLVLKEMTGAFWRSAFVAAVFAIHPLRVESVAWVAERKDVLSGLFFMLTLAAYVRYIRRQTLRCYLFVALLFACGLMSKAVSVTVPFVLLLLDYWPLGRFDNSKIIRSTGDLWWNRLPIPRRLVVEKVPLLLLSVGASVATLFAQERAMSSLEKLPLLSRINNAFIAIIDYLWQTFWPTKLAVFYPYPANGPAPWQIVLSVTLLLAITASVFTLREKRPYLLTGWFWFVGMLVPNIGIVQAGSQARADRFTYLPHIGLCILVTWAVADMTTGWRRRHFILGATAATAIIALMFLAAAQTRYWRNSESLWIHTLPVNPQNPVAEGALGAALMTEGRIDEAITHFKKGLEIWPTDAGAHNNLGNALLGKRQLDEAIVHYGKAVELQPNNPMAYYNLGVAYFRKGNLDEAITDYKKAIEIQPDYPDGYGQLGNALLQKGEVDAAIASWKESLNTQPANVATRNNLAVVLAQHGRLREAIRHWQDNLEVDPGNIEAQNDLAWAFATSPDPTIRNAARAVNLAEGAVRSSTGKNPGILRTLAAAFAESGRFSDAIRVAEQAMLMAGIGGNVDLQNQIRNDVQLYRSHMPLRDKNFVDAQPAAKTP